MIIITSTNTSNDYNKDNNSFNEKNKHKASLRRVYRYILSLLPFLLAHHPDCKEFEGHTIKAGKYKLCIGCFIGYPVAVIGIFLIDIFNLNRNLSNETLLIIGLLFLASFALSPLDLTKNKRVKIIQKVIIGLGASFLFWYIKNLPITLIEQIFWAMWVFGFLISLLNVYHIYTFFSKCKKCEEYFNWEKCDGFKTVRNNFKKYSLESLFIAFPDISTKLKERSLKKKKNIVSS